MFFTHCLWTDWTISRQCHDQPIHFSFSNRIRFVIFNNNNNNKPIRTRFYTVQYTINGFSFRRLNVFDPFLFILSSEILRYTLSQCVLWWVMHMRKKTNIEKKKQTNTIYTKHRLNGLCIVDSGILSLLVSVDFWSNQIRSDQIRYFRSIFSPRFGSVSFVCFCSCSCDVRGSGWSNLVFIKIKHSHFSFCLSILTKCNVNRYPNSLLLMIDFIVDDFLCRVYENSWND